VPAKRFDRIDRFAHVQAGLERARDEYAEAERRADARMMIFWAARARQQKRRLADLRRGERRVELECLRARPRPRYATRRPRARQRRARSRARSTAARGDPHDGEHHRVEVAPSEGSP
jgi:hypothetical protein